MTGKEVLQLRVPETGSPQQATGGAPCKRGFAAFVERQEPITPLGEQRDRAAGTPDEISRMRRSSSPAFAISPAAMLIRLRLH